MDVYIYSDESGVFDKEHNDFYVYGGVVFLSKESRDVAIRKYRSAENTLKKNEKYKDCPELKACKLSNKDKSKMFRTLNNCIKFGVIIDQKKVLERIFWTKKDKQRYLDYAYKIGLKNCFKKLIQENILDTDDVRSLKVYVDEHTTATNGRYELREGLEQEFKNGTYNLRYDKFFEPLFPGLNSVNLQYCNSSKQVLIRAADIVANRIYYESIRGDTREIAGKVYLKNMP